MSDLAIRKELLTQRLQDVALPKFHTKSSKQRKKISTITSVTDPIVPTLSRTSDTHWDYLLKEMQWLAADFTAERQRHAVARKKLAGAVVAWQRGAAAREAKRYDAAVAFQRKTATRIQRAVSQWWAQLDRVITYQQRCVYETGQRTTMNQQLVRLVQQTERYTNAQQQQQYAVDDDVEVVLQQREQRLGMGQRQRRGPDDYATLDRQMKSENDNESDAGSIDYYVDSVAGDDADGDDDDTEGGGDEDYQASDADDDDESTMRQAEEEEMRDRGHEDDFVADPEELRLLQEEATMPLQELLEKSRDPSVQFPDIHDSVEESSQKEENYDEDDDDGEFVADAEMVDDETTMEAEERLPREMTPAEKLELLQRENEMSVDDLRKQYYANNGDDDDEMMEDAESHDETRMDEGSDGSDEFAPDEIAVDDETTLEVEEKLGRDMSYADEIALLNQESEMSIDELRAKYAEPQQEQQEELESFPELLGTPVGDEENDEDFEPGEAEVDDETTIEAEERMGREMTAEEEIALLEAESKMSIEDIRNMYKASNEENTDRGAEHTAPSDGRTKHRLSENEGGNLRSKRQRKARDEEPAENRLTVKDDSSRTSRVTRPFLIPSWVKLREYQLDGLSWLVSLQARRLNGILADEMGLGKTLQTISLLSYLAAFKGIWGPHLVVVPTSVMLNWETELKRFCPALKVLCYYGSAKRRKELRTGWTKSNFYHVVITSYQLAVQDAFAFKRKKWYYLILDEAQHIKNFQSQRWQTLITFNTQRRLLLTGTPLQNNLMELWSLLHFLMPYLFSSRKEFSYWFANPMTNMIEGKATKNDDVVNRLHGIIRPFVLRRLKKDVETQLPGKFEHIVKCQLSRRQMFIYEEFMARSTTWQALRKGGNFMGMMTVLMQLRKVCNHPDLFEPRSVVTPFTLDPIRLAVPSCVFTMTESKRVFETTSPQLLQGLWCGSEGAPSFEAAVQHDQLISCDLLQLEDTLTEPDENTFVIPVDGIIPHPVVNTLARDLSHSRFMKRVETIHTIKTINKARCASNPFVFNRRLLQSFTVDAPFADQNELDILTTPSQLLAARKIQSERALSESSNIKWFAFAVPKASASSPTPEVGYPIIGADMTVRERLKVAQEVAMAPFHDAQARLSSFFPDKRLVQFDAGKLQTLARLLRERYAGGHKVLIFTQMGKMLDILEVFLNLNGHSYLRLD